MINNTTQGSILKCVSIHGNSRSAITIGNTYEVTKVFYRYYLGIKKPVEFCIIDDKGKERRYILRTKMFELADGSDLYNNEQLRLMECFGKEIDILNSCYDDVKENSNIDQEYHDAIYERDRAYKVREYLILIIKAKNVRDEDSPKEFFVDNKHLNSIGKEICTNPNYLPSKQNM